MASHIERRKFLATLGGAAVAWPLAARAQQPAMPVIGFLGSASPDLYAIRLRTFRQALKEAGYVEGQNVMIEYRWAAGRYDRLPDLAADLVRRGVAVLVVPGNAASALAARDATTSIPIVFAISGNPVKLGLVASISQPGGNLTGVNFFHSELLTKRFGLLRELLRAPALIAVLVNPSNPEAEGQLKEIEEAARAIGQRILVLKASSNSEIDTAFATAVEQRADAILLNADTLFNNRRVQIVSLAARHVLPAIYVWRDWVMAGGLMSYGIDLPRVYHQVGAYSGRILKGEKPANLPVVQPKKFELVINLKTAKALREADRDSSYWLTRRSDVRFRGQTGKHTLVLSLTGFEPKRSFGAYSTCLSALVPDRAMEAWYHPSIA